MAPELDNAKQPHAPESASQCNKIADSNGEFLFGDDLEAISDLIDEADFEKKVEEINCKITEEACIIFS